MMPRWKRSIATLGAIASLLVTIAPAFADTGATAGQVVALALQQDGKTPFTGTRSQQVIRQDMVLHASAKVNFKDNNDYQFAITQPEDIQGLNLVVDQGQLTTFFPKESLLFQSDSTVGTEEAKNLIMGHLTDDPRLLAQNYNVTLAPDFDIVALYPCYKLTFEPKAGLGPEAPPGRRIWIAKENGAILREERYWTRETPAYFQSQYDSFSTSQPPQVRLTVPRDVSRLKLEAGTPTSMVRYASIAAARAAGKAIYAPSVVPQGFVLKAVDVMSLYGTDIVLLRYTDGLNYMTVTYRTKPNAFLTLMAGAFALSLVDKISQLSYHAPNNYAVVDRGNYLVYAYGDLWQDYLTRIAQSVPVPVAAKSAGQ